MLLGLFFWIMDIVIWIGKSGLILLGFVTWTRAVIELGERIIYAHRTSQIHKGQIYAVETHKDNPYRETITVHAEVIDYKDGYVFFRMEGTEASLPVDNFLKKFRVWYSAYEDSDA